MKAAKTRALTSLLMAILMPAPGLAAVTAGRIEDDGRRELWLANPDHGHPVGIYSRRAVMESVIELARAVREESPEMFLNITSGTWLTPGGSSMPTRSGCRGATTATRRCRRSAGAMRRSPTAT